MKETTVHSLITAKTLFEKARGLCISEDRYRASAGLVILQDALEIVFYALLIERGVDEKKNIEQLSFDALIGELKKEGIKVPKSGTLKASNKARVLTKHYAQVAEPTTVRNYLQAAQQALEHTVNAVFGKSLTDIYLTDLLDENEAKGFLKQAEKYIAKSQFFDALMEIRKAIFVEFEFDYSVHRWRDYEADESMGNYLTFLWSGGLKAPNWKRNKKWIQENVQDPLDYIQIDYEKWRLDAMEWGINTAELENLRNLTPEAFRADTNSQWCFRHDMDFPTEAATLENAKYCLDRTIAVTLKKQEHKRTSRRRSRDLSFEPPSIYLGDNLYKRASTKSEVVHIISKDFQYNITEIASGFDPTETFYSILASSNETDEKGLPKSFPSGFLLIREEEKV